MAIEVPLENFHRLVVTALRRLANLAREGKSVLIPDLDPGQRLGYIAISPSEQAARKSLQAAKGGPRLSGATSRACWSVTSTSYSFSFHE